MTNGEWRMANQCGGTASVPSHNNNSCSPNMESDGRNKPIHLPPREQHNTPIIVFLTVCTKNKNPILDDDAVHDVLKQSWKTRPSWQVGRYVIMPDHIHLFCAPTELVP